MKTIALRTHGYLDYATVIVFLVAPKLIEFDGIPAFLCWGLAAVHLGLTLATDFPLGRFPWIPISVHGWVEKIVGPLLIAIPFLLGFADVSTARNFFLLIGIVILAVSWLTDYSEGSQRS